MIKDWSVGTQSWLAVHWKRVLIFGGGGLLAVLIFFQLFYPANKLLPFTTIDNISVSGWSKKDATRQLDQAYAGSTLDIYFGTAKTAYRSVKPADIGATVQNQKRVDNVQYPWYLRLVPGSLLWGHWVVKVDKTPVYDRNIAVLGAYIAKELGDSCSVEAKDASLEVKNGELKLLKSADGGTCNISDVTNKLRDAQFTITTKARADIPVTVVPPAVSDIDAQNMADKLTSIVKDGIGLKAGGSIVTIPKDQLIGWLDFAVTDKALDYAFNVDRAADYLEKNVTAKVAVGPGVTKVATYDFVETSRVNGTNGQTLNKAATLANLKTFINGGAGEAVAATSPVAPTVTYTHSYSASDVGLSALMKNYAEAHPGTFGISLIELSGKNRRASYSADKVYTAASTYKLFVAYSALKRVEAGMWQWTDQIDGGRDLTKCFDDMIVKSDNACAAALLKKIGYTNSTNEAHAIGCNGTSFLGSDGIKTTPADLALLLALLQKGQILDQQSSRDRLIDAMKRNIYRQGIPAGVTGTVADKVGFLDGLLHDAAIVYAPTGPYVLVIMSDGSSWATIADLTRQIEALRLQ